MLKRILIIFFVLTIFVLLWQFGETYISNERLLRGDTGLEAFIPTPTSILNSLVSDRLIILTELGYTLGRAFSGLFFGIVLAFFMAILFLFYKSLRNIFYPISFGLNSFPVVGLAPLIILIFGQGSGLGIVFISTIICYFPILVALDRGFKETDKELVEFMYVLNASRSQVLLKVQLPLAMPYFLMALRLAVPASIIGATMGEWLGTRNGIGQIITIALYQLKPALLYSSLLSVTLVCLGSVGLILFVEKNFMPWKKEYQAE